MQRTIQPKPIRRRAQRGFSLLEIIVAIAIIAMISSAIAVSIMIQQDKANKSLTATNAGTIRHGVKMWWIDHDMGTCPSVKELVADGAIDRGKVDRDAWGQPWKIVCDTRDATVISRGPDKTPDTEDDIRVPPPS